MAGELQNAILSSGSGTDSPVDSSQVNQYEILSKVLGERSDYQRGVGYRGKARKTASSSSSQSGASSHPARSRFSDEDLAAVVNMIQALRDVNPQSQSS